MTWGLLAGHWAFPGVPRNALLCPFPRVEPPCSTGAGASSALRASVFELELELILSHMTQKPMLRGETSVARCNNQGHAQRGLPCEAFMRENSKSTYIVDTDTVYEPTAS
jgi:hypothetical protein